MMALNDNGAERSARSPWSRDAGYGEVRIIPASAPVDARLTVPGSKSLTNRALIAAALAEGTSWLDGFLRSDDSYWCIDCLRRLGIAVQLDGETIRVQGAGGRWPVREGELFTGAAGTVARFLPGALAAGQGVWTIAGSRRLNERPLSALLDALAGLGAGFEYAGAAGRLPLTLRANGLRGGETTLPGTVSSQFISGILLAAPYAQDVVTVRIEGEMVQRDYVELTLDTMRAFGVRPAVRDGGQTVTVTPGAYQACELKLEPDVSTCCYFWALAALTNGRVRIDGISGSTRQPDIEFLRLLEQMGCTVRRGDGFVEVVGAPRLRGGFAVNMRRWSDQTLTVAALAAFADGPISLTDAAHIRTHECDRIFAVCTELRKLGLRVDERPDGLTVHPGPVRPALLDAHDDHRMAMALSLIGVRADGIRIADPGCVSKTCPDFFDRLRDSGIGTVFAEPGGAGHGR